MLRGSTTLLSAPPGGVPAHAPPPRSRRHASRRSARQKCHNQNSRATRRPPPKKRKGRQKRRPSSQGGVCGERVKQAGVPPAFMGSKGSRAGGTNPQTTPISVANYVSQPNWQRLNALLILAFFIFFGGLPSLQITTYYLTFNLY